jgi:lipid-A-disaccharide synthase
MKILISCGEPSGDLYAGALAREIRALDSSVRILGLGGDHLRSAGAEIIEDYQGLTVTGLSEALAILPRSFSIYRRLVQLSRSERPDVFVPIDFPDFNFRLAQSVSRLGIPVVYYVCPQLWAWRRARLRSMKRFTNRALVIFPFEEEFYRKSGIATDFVGHPLLDLAKTRQCREEFLLSQRLDPVAPTVALLPGSRPNEVLSILPNLVRAAQLISARVPNVQFVIARAPHLKDDVFSSLETFKNQTQSVAIVSNQTNEVLSSSDVAVTASGTATVQAAIHGCPMVIVYRLSRLTYSLVKFFTDIKNVGMVNVLAGSKVVPELIQDSFTPNAVTDEVVSFLRDRDRAKQTQNVLENISKSLGTQGASRRAAKIILSEAGHVNF